MPPLLDFQLLSCDLDDAVVRESETSPLPTPEISNDLDRDAKMKKIEICASKDAVNVAKPNETTINDGEKLEEMIIIEIAKATADVTVSEEVQKISKREDITDMLSHGEQAFKTDDDDSDTDVSYMTTGTSPVSSEEENDAPPAKQEVYDVMMMEIKFDGRDVLDLAQTLRWNPWNLQPAVLPPMNLKMFWLNRSQYHRLGNYGFEESEQIECSDCGHVFNKPLV